MITFEQPKKLNGSQLRKELNDAGVVISNDPESVKSDGFGNLSLDIKIKDEPKATIIVNAHDGIDTSFNLALIKKSAQTKLAALGLTEEEVASSLG